MRPPPPHRGLPQAGVLALAFVALFGVVNAAEAAPDPPTALDCARLDCGAVLPGAVRFEAQDEGPWKTGFDAAGELAGWVVLSTDVVDIKAYSGKPMMTLVGLTPDGVIAGVRVVHHSEPILLVGIPEKALTDFVDSYRGKRADAKIVVGGSSEPGAITVDVISGATVTVLAENRTILDTARALGSAVGVLTHRPAVPGHFVESAEVWSWQRMVEEGVFGRLTVTRAEMGERGEGPFVDLYFAVANAPQVGRALLGDREYAWQMEQLGPDEHLLVVLGNGSSSFKGSGFVRGGIFDRVRLEQGLRSVMFTDKDYRNLSQVAAAGAPHFKEGALFTVREGRLDPGAPFDLVFLGSRHKGGGFTRDFHAVGSTHRLPKSTYVLDGPDPDQAIWRAAWAASKVRIAVLLAILLGVAGLFFARRFLTGRMARLNRIHLVVLLLSFFVLGLGLRAQPSITQVLTAIDGIVGEWRWALFLSEPVVFISWIFVALVTVTWGRGVFCGWVCPYGALTELLFRAGRKLRLPNLELPDRWHLKLRWFRYVVLAALIGTFLYSPALGELLAEVEPFKTTFFVRPWIREVGFIAWWSLLLAASLVTFRPFCRYVCPLGAALAIPGSLRFAGPRRRDFCSKCKICTRTCEPKAIRPDGTIDPRECLSCMECEANYWDEQVCPPLVKEARAREQLLQINEPRHPSHTPPRRHETAP